MNDNYFLDTNILIYALDKSGDKKTAAIDLLTEDAMISTQVINEISNVLRKKHKFEYSLIANIIEEYLQSLKLVLINKETIKLAWFIAEKYNYSYYDSLIISSALENNCSILYSEDMQHNQLIEKRLTIMNPFTTILPAEVKV